MRLKLAYTSVPRSRAGSPNRRVPIVPLEVWVRDRDGYEHWHELPFLLDTGSDYCLMHHDWAEHTGVVVRALGARSAIVHTSAGDVEARTGRIHVRLGGKTHDWRCGFTVPASEEGSEGPREDDHNHWVTMEIGGLSQTRRFLLGRSDFFKRYVVLIDRDYIVITDRRMFFRCVANPLLWIWNKFLTFLWS